MKLADIDLNYINQRMDICELKYQEVYDEIKDHVILAIETARAGGDERDIADVYEDMMDTQFPGYYAFERIAISYEKAYRVKIKKMVWGNFRHYLNPLNVTVIALTLVAGYYMPDSKVTFFVLFPLLLIVSLFPVIYARIKTANIKVDNGKKSIIKEYIRNRSVFLIFNYYVVIKVFDFFTDFWNVKPFAPHTLSPIFNLLVVALSVIYGLSITRLCRQEIKSATLNIYK